MTRAPSTETSPRPKSGSAIRSIALVLLALFFWACEGKHGVILFNPMNDTRGIVHKSRVSFDPHTSTDGSGSIRIDSDNSWTLNLFETGDIDVRGTTLVYQADFKTEALNGLAYLELRCTFPDGKERSAWGLSDPMTGTRAWHTQRVEMRLRRSENPTNVKLSVYVDALGTLWIDNVRLSR